MKRGFASTERLYSVRELKEAVFTSGSERWIKDKLKAGEFGDVIRDAGGWLIPESGVLRYMNRHRVSVDEARETIARQLGPQP